MLIILFVATQTIDIFYKRDSLSFIIGVVFVLVTTPLTKYLYKKISKIKTKKGNRK